MTDQAQPEQLQPAPIIDQLRAHRRSLDITVAEVAERIGSSSRSIIAWECGYRGLPPLERLAAYAAAIGLHLHVDIRLLPADDSITALVASGARPHIPDFSFPKMGRGRPRRRPNKPAPPATESEARPG